MPRSDNEIAVDVVKLLKLDDDDKVADFANLLKLGDDGKIHDKIIIAGVVLNVGDDNKTICDKIIAGIVKQLAAVRRAYQGGDDVVKADQLKADIEAERRRLQRLKDKWRRIAAVEIVCDRADYELATLAKVSGPDPRYQWFDDVCAIMARGMILQSPDTRLGARLRELAGYLYEAATDIPDRDLETACRRATPPKKKQTSAA
jgi:hypothetical protein